MFPKHKHRVKSILYHLFPGKISDNQARIDFVKNLARFDWQSISEGAQAPIIQITPHILQEFAWQDQHASRLLTDALKATLPVIPEPMREVFYHNTKGLSIQRLTSFPEENVVSDSEEGFEIFAFDSEDSFSGLEFESFDFEDWETLSSDEEEEDIESDSITLNPLKALDLGEFMQGYFPLFSKLQSLCFEDYDKFAFSSNHATLEKIECPDVFQIEGLEHLQMKTLRVGEAFPRISTWEFMSPNTTLEELDCSSSSLRQLCFSAPFANLKILNLAHSPVQKLQGLEHLSALTMLDLSETRELRVLQFEHRCPNLQTLCLDNSSIESLTGLEKLPALKVLDLQETGHLQKIKFSLQMSNLEELRLNGSYLDQLSGLKYLSALRVLELDSTPNLQTPLYLTQAQEHLQVLSVGNSGILKIYGLQQAQDLRRLDLYSVKQQESLKFCQGHKFLTELDVRGLSLKRLTGVGYLPTEGRESVLKMIGAMKSLKVLDLSGWTEQANCRFYVNESVRTLAAPNAKDFSYLELLEAFPGVEDVDFSGAQGEAVLDFPQKCSIRKLNLENAQFQEIRHFENLTYLENLLCSGLKGPENLELTPAHGRLEKIDLSDTDVFLTGLENLRWPVSLSLNNRSFPAILGEKKNIVISCS